MTKQVLTAGKIVTDHFALQRVLTQVTPTDDGPSTAYSRCCRGETGPMLRAAAYLASQTLRSPVL